MARLRRTLLAVLAVGALVGACSSGDDDGSAAGAATTTTRDDGDVLVEEPCEVLDPADLEEVTGLEFDDATPSPDTCVYTSSGGLAAIALNFRAGGDSTPAAALEAAEATCEEGTVQALELANSDGGFGCLVGGVPTVVATGGGIVAILTGSTLQQGVDPAQILRDLATILSRALGESVG
jgi:hypothetical protein